MVDLAGLRRLGASSARRADVLKGRPKQAAVDAVINERLLSADEKRGDGGSIGWMQNYPTELRGRHVGRPARGNSINPFALGWKSYLTRRLASLELCSDSA